MSQNAQPSSSPLKNNYEKVILLVLLVLLIASCAFLSRLIIDQRGSNDNFVANTQLGGEAYALQDTLQFDTMLANARKTATKPLANPKRSFVSERRVACVKCGKPIPYEALKCPFCLQDQPEIINPDTIDTDQDGMPDKLELTLGLDPQNPADAYGDLDNDGFTNIEEYQAGTDLRDPASRPDPVVKLRVWATRPIPFYLRFVSVSELADKSLRFQLNMQSEKAPTLFVKLNDVTLGYKIAKFDPNGENGPTLTLIRVSDNRVVNLVQEHPVTENEIAILFVSLINRTKLPVKRKGDSFTLADNGKQYKVVDIKGQNVIIQDVETMKTINIPKITEAERSGDPAAAMPPPGTSMAAPARPAPAPTLSPFPPPPGAAPGDDIFGN